MRTLIREFLEPSKTKKREIWNKAIFVFDTNVLLNLYRYSAKTRNSLLNAFEELKNRVWIPYQVAYEYMNRRCNVIYETVHRYEQFEKEIENFVNKITSILRLTSGDEEVVELMKYLKKWLSGNKDRNLLVLNANDDEILERILDIFEGRVGQQLEGEKLDAIETEGKERYAKKIPPGYKDNNKGNEQSSNNSYGDLIIWKQIINYSAEQDVDIVFVTHDQKEDWWNIEKGKTIGPRIELRREFMNETHHEFHMYSMRTFIDTYNMLNKAQIEKSAVDEVLEFDWKKSDKFANNQLDGVSEKIQRAEDTLEKIENRIKRRKAIIENIDYKYNGNEGQLPEDIRVQYENTKIKLKELEAIYENKQKELNRLLMYIQRSKLFL